MYDIFRNSGRMRVPGGIPFECTPCKRDAAKSGVPVHCPQVHRDAFLYMTIGKDNYYDKSVMMPHVCLRRPRIV